MKYLALDWILDGVGSYKEYFRDNWIKFQMNDLSSVWRRICYAKSLQLFLTLCDPIDGSPPGSPITGILQAGTLEWAAISFSNA